MMRHAGHCGDNPKWLILANCGGIAWHSVSGAFADPALCFDPKRYANAMVNY